MNQACRRCLAATTSALRTTTLNHHIRTTTTTLTNHNKLLHTTSITSREKTGMAHLFKDGKRIVHEVEDMTVLDHLLLKFKSFDEPSLDGGFEFAKKAAKMTSMNVTKSFRMPGKEEVFQSVVQDDGAVNQGPVTDGSGKKTIEYRLKRYERCIALEKLTADQMEVYLSFVYQSLPVGVSVDVMLMRWEEYVDPNNPLLHKDKKAAVKEIMKDTMSRPL